MAAYTEEDILGVLDDAQDRVTWPDFEHLDYDILYARLSAYRDDERWAVVFGMVQWNPSSNTVIVVMTEPLGNCIELPDDEDEAFNACRFDTVAFEFEPDNEDLAEVGYVSNVKLRGKEFASSIFEVKADPDSDRDETFWLAVAVTEKYHQEILPTEKELARFFPNGMPPKFLEVSEWHHSKWGLASEWEVFQLLAKAIVAGDPALYQPTEEPNTDWRDWVSK